MAVWRIRAPGIMLWTGSLLQAGSLKGTTLIALFQEPRKTEPVTDSPDGALKAP